MWFWYQSPQINYTWWWLWEVDNPVGCSILLGSLLTAIRQHILYWSLDLYTLWHFCVTTEWKLNHPATHIGNVCISVANYNSRKTCMWTPLPLRRKKSSRWLLSCVWGCDNLQHINVNSLWPNDAIWRDTSGPTLARVMACCLAVLSLELMFTYLQWGPLTLGWGRFDNRFLEFSAINR